MRFLLRLTLLFCLTLLFAASVSAASDASISGTVTDQNGALIAGAHVEARHLSSGRTATTQTDASGQYELTGLEFGEYRVSAERAGFAFAVRSFVLRAGGITGADFLLVPGVIQDTVNVTAGKGSARLDIDTPQAISVVGAREIEARRPQSVMGAVEGVPNLIAVGANPLAARPRLRGLTSNRLLIIIDGERLNNVRSDPFSGISPGIFDVLGLESAEVLSGAGSSLYGSDAIAGAINLVSKDPVRREHGHYLGLRFDGDVRSNGSFRRSAGTLNWSTSRFALRAGGSLFRLDNYRSGGAGVSLAEVLRIGRFANELGNAVNSNVARTYAVWELPAGAEVVNGQGRGFYSNLDLWLFATPKQTIRYHQLGNQHKDIGFAFMSPPFDVRRQYNGFRRLDKQGLRYEAQGSHERMPRLSLRAYRQKYSFPDDVLTHTINPGSSWDTIANPDSPTGALPVLTGNVSTFTPANFIDGKSTVTSYGAEAQATFALAARATLTTGVGYLRDSSADEFSRVDFDPVTHAPRNALSGRASTPDAVYRNLSWSNLLEYEPLQWLRLTGSLRVDNWQTRARVTPGFPLGTESAILDASFEALRAQPGSLDIEGASGILQLIGGARDIETKRTSITGNVGAVLRLPGGVNPYVRWGTSYREPGVTERYLLRNFGDATFSVPLIPNTALKPERGNNYDIGLKVRRERWGATFEYFRNDLRDFISSEFSPALFVPARPESGLQPISPSFPFHGVLYVQRANTDRARIQGYEATYEANIPLGARGSLTPFGTLGWLKGSNLTPDENALQLIRSFYNRTDTPVPLRGSERDVPLPGISPFGGLFGARYGDREGTWSGEYEVRYRARVTRVDPADLSTSISTQYGSFASLNSFTRHALRAGYNYRRDKYRLSLSVGIENLADRLYFEPFQNAPAPGRSYVFGLTLDSFDLLRR